MDTSGRNETNTSEYMAGKRNDDRDRVLDCTEAHDLAEANTFFTKRPAHLVTYTSGGRTTQIY